MRQMPRIARRRPREIEGRSTVRKFVGGELAHEGRTGLVKLRCRGGVHIGHAIEAHFGMPPQPSTTACPEVFALEQPQRSSPTPSGGACPDRAAPRSA